MDVWRFGGTHHLLRERSGTVCACAEEAFGALRSQIWSSGDGSASGVLGVLGGVPFCFRRGGVNRFGFGSPWRRAKVRDWDGWDGSGGSKDVRGSW